MGSAFFPLAALGVARKYGIASVAASCRGYRRAPEKSGAGAPVFALQITRPPSLPRPRAARYV